MSSETRILLIMAALFFALFGYTHQRNYDSSTPASRLCLLFEICAHGRFEINHSIVHTPDKAIVDGRYYSDKAPGMAVAALPGFGIGWFSSEFMNVGRESRLLFASWLGCAMSSGLILAIGAAFLWKLTSQFANAKAALVTIFAMIFGAAPFPYATMMHSHSLVVGLLSYSLWRVCRKDEAATQDPACEKFDLLGGFCCGWALASEYTSGLVVVGMCAYFCATAKRSRIQSFFMGLFPPLLLIPLYSIVTIGTAFRLPYSYQASFPAMQHGIYAIQWPDPETAFNLLFSPARGLLFWSPFLVMAGFGYYKLAQTNRPLFFLTYLVPMLQIIVISGRRWDWMAGPTFGPRYLTPMLPLMAIPVAIGIQEFPRLGMLSAAYSIMITTLATITDACPSYRHPNPLFDLQLPLLCKGQFGPNLGEVVGVPSYVSILIFYAVMLGGFLFLWRYHDHHQLEAAGKSPL